MVQRYILLAAGIGWLGVQWAIGQQSILSNPTKRFYSNEVVRLTTLAPGGLGSVVVRQNGAEMPYQVESRDGTNWVWICADFEPGASHQFEIASGRPKDFPRKVKIGKEGDAYVLDNGLVAVRVPAVVSGSSAPGPIAGLKFPGQWVGGSTWRSSTPLRNFSAKVTGDGTIFGRVSLRYDFDGRAGLDGQTPAFAEFDVTLKAGANHVEIRERHEMGPDAFWEFEVSKGWSPRTGLSAPFSAGAGSGKVGGKVEPQRPLKPGGLPYGRADLFINLFPRWNQHYKDGWFFAATDGQRQVGAVVVSASQWIWPHDNALEAIVKESGDYAGLRCRTWRGQRVWWLFGPSAVPADKKYVAQHAWENLDKLNHEFILDWPGQKPAPFPGMDLYSSQMNPSSAIRGMGRRAVVDAGKPGGLAKLLRAQHLLHPDAYGSYWNYWSPENPNFFTDFMRVPIATVARLKTHPRFEELRRQAELKFREDMYHSVTLPGGAGQECPGYVSYALRQWTEMAQVCREHLGFDPTRWERYAAAERFLVRISQPDGNVRRMLPMGDTHPDKSSGGPKPVLIPAEESLHFVTEELPGFGVVFSHRSFTPGETYLAFKSGPNRGHYHGDQLAFHYCANAKALAVDHHCSYSPRAGQEHMHNRVAFHTRAFPYANMDGYERLIAFKTSAVADVAIGQVESDRLRQVEPLPPEIWHQEYPQHLFAKPLVYRRTIVLMKGDPQDYFVIRDQYWAPEALNATFCLHVRSDSIQQKGARVDFGNLSLFCAAPEKFEFSSLPWNHSNGGDESTQGARLTIHGGSGQFITVLYPGQLPETKPIPNGVRVAADEIVFAGDGPTAGDAAVYVTVKRAAKTVLTLSGTDIDLDRSQGEVGLFVPDAGYPFGTIPDWLARQRAKRPAWAQ